MNEAPPPPTNAAEVEVEAWFASVVTWPSAPAPSPVISVSADPELTRRLSLDAWAARALAGIKRMHEDEAYRLSLNARLS